MAEAASSGGMYAAPVTVMGTFARAPTRLVPEETPVALVYNGGTYGVMMATPTDLEDFAIGFSLSERIVPTAADVQSARVVSHPAGIEVRMRVADALALGLAQRRRALAGPVGCGLCGVDSLAEAARPVAQVAETGTRYRQRQIVAAMAELAEQQPMHAATRAMHAAGYWEAERGLVAVREDVGRHNALDKLAGALARRHVDARCGVLLLTSRVSVELVQKASVLGVAVIAAVSAPTALAIRTAAAAGMTLAAIVRSDGFEIFTHQHRITATPHDLALHD